MFPFWYGLTMRTLYRLKSNPKTIVIKKGDFSKVATWIVSRWNKENVTKLNEVDSAAIEKKIKNFRK